MAQTLLEPPGAGKAPGDPLHFIVGQDRTGNWVVTETHGLYGGIFCDKVTALALRQVRERRTSERARANVGKQSS
jgi:hypothetical protein